MSELESEAYLENVVPALFRGVALLPLPGKVSQLDSATYLENVVLTLCRGVTLLPLPCKVSQLDSATYLEFRPFAVGWHSSLFPAR